MTNPADVLAALPVDVNALPAMLVEVALKGTMLLGIAMAAAILLRRSTATIRHMVWSMSLAGLLIVPVLALMLPGWSVPLLPASLAQPTSETQAIGRRAAVDMASRRTYPDAGSPTAEDTRTSPGTALSSSKTRAADMNATTAPVDASTLSVMQLLALVWLGGIAAGLVALTGGLLALRRLARRARPFEDESWAALLEDVRRGLGISRPVLLLQSGSAAMPATWGISKPVVLLPAGADDWTEDRRRVVLLHELAHVRRNDCLMQIVAQVCCAAYWFHPAVWYTARRMRAERELACDEHVLDAGVNACDYAAHLLDIARVFRAPAGTSMAAIAMARPTQLEGRLLAILDDEPDRRRVVRPITRVLVLSTLALVALPLAAMRPWRGGPAELVAASNLSPSVGESPVFGMAAAPDTFRWRGTVAQGQWVEIHSTLGDIRAERAEGSEVEVFATLQSQGRDMPAKIVRDMRRGAARFCVVEAAAGASCDDDMSGGVRNRAGSVRTDILVKVPRGVGLAAHTVTGNIAAEAMQSYVWGTSRRGDIAITTTDLAEASTGRGSISASFGKASWSQNLEFLSDSGDVTVHAPSNSRMMFEVMTGRGRVTSEFPGQARAFGAGGQRAVAKLGEGGGMLTIQTLRGKAELRRGPNGAGGSSASSFGNAPFSYTDSKPNPNPDPDASYDSNYDPNPNPNPNPDPNPNPNPKPNPNPNPNPDPLYDPNPDPSPGGDNPTGEVVSVRIPAGIVSRYADAALRGAPDARAIAVLRDIAASHVKKHAVDLVRERALWSLTMVHDGRIIAPLSAALRDSDWRVRAYAAWALGATGDSRRLDPLTLALNDPHWRVRMQAASSLGTDARNTAVEPLLGLLADNHWQVRIAAVDALAGTGDRRAIDSVKRLLRDSHSAVRDGARAVVEGTAR